MNRLTKRTICGTANLAYPESCYFKSGVKDQVAVSAYRQQAIERLAEYEDTGLEPEKIVFLKNVVDDAFSDKPEFIEHVRELLRAEQDGRVMVLPCRVGDRIYRVVDDCTFPGDCGTKRMCNGCEYRNLSIEETTFCLYLLDDDGKLRRGYYCTYEEAEKALEEV
mgnify:FL=1|jgi:hypothetical protein